jgi:predicted  nucleic acid-binding Zn-ribbon protein
MSTLHFAGTLHNVFLRSLCYVLALSFCCRGNSIWAQNPCAANAAYRLAQLKANQSEVDLQQHLAKKPADADPAWQNSLNQLGVKQHELQQAIKTAEKNITIANNDLALKSSEAASAEKKATDLAAARVALEQDIAAKKAVWSTPAAGLVRDYDTCFKQVTAVVPAEDLHEARTRIRDPLFTNFKDERINKLRRDIAFFETNPGQNSQQRLAEMRPLLQGHIDVLLKLIDDAEKVKRELLEKHQLYPWSAEAEAARQADTVVSGARATLDANQTALTAARAEATRLQTEAALLVSRVKKANDDLTAAKENEKLGLADLERLRNTLESKISDASKSLTRWHQNKLHLEKAQVTALEEMEKAEAAAKTAVAAAEAFTTGVKTRWAAFKNAVTEKFNTTKQQIAEAASDFDKDKIRATVRPWFQNASQLVPKFTAELEGSPYTGLCEECNGVRQLIAETKAFNGQIDAIVATLDAKVKHEAIELSGQWACACGSTWAITKYGDNSAEGARYAVVISNGDWSARLAGSFDNKTKTLTVAGQDSKTEQVTVVLTYDTHKGRLGGTYMNRTTGKTDAEDVWRTQ